MAGSPAASGRRGQPIVMLALLGAAWIGARAMLWDFPVLPQAVRAQTSNVRITPLAAAAPDRSMRERKVAAGATFIPRGGIPGHGAAVTQPARLNGRLQPIAPGVGEATDAAAALPRAFEMGGAGKGPGLASVGAAILRLPTGRAGQGTARRWSIDGWYAWRDGSGLPRRAAGGPLAAGYGGTQGGVLARIALGEGRRRPQAFVRLTHAPDRPAQADLALGLGLRPLARLPVRLLAEARATRAGGRTTFAPAATVVTEFPVLELPHGLRAEGYGQAGWIGGDFATGFVDGQVRADRKILDIGGGALRLGGGAWGGAQKFAARLDVGPGLTLDLRNGKVPVRVSVDYRFQVAGNARPDDGIAVTLSTGF